MPSIERKGGISFVNNFNFYYSTGIDQYNVRLKETWKFDYPDSINETNGEADFTYYPNPITNFVEIKKQLTNCYVQLIDLNGKVLFQYFSDKNDISLDLSNFAAGVYVLQIMGEEEIIPKKITKI